MQYRVTEHHDNGSQIFITLNRHKFSLIDYCNYKIVEILTQTVVSQLIFLKVKTAVLISR